MIGPSAAQIEPFEPLPVVPYVPEETRPARTPLVRDLGDGHHAVTFLWHGEAERVLVLVNTVAEGHRDDLGPVLMERIEGTDVWHRTFRCRSDLRATYQLYPAHGPIDAADPEVWAHVRRRAIPDPLNPDRLPSWIPGAVTSVLELPGAPPQPWLRPRPGVPAGAVTGHRVPSAALGGDRTVHVYVPAAGPADGEPYDLVVLLDGDLWTGPAPFAPTLDNLIAESRIPPAVALMPASGGYTARNAELGGDEAFLEFLTRELPEWAAARLPVTADPGRSVIAGQSLGGRAAAAAALRAPGRYGRVIAQSGAFWLDGESLTREVRPSPVRFHLEVGRGEWRLRPAVLRFRDALRATGHDAAYREYSGGHDLACWRGGLADALRALARPGTGVQHEGVR